MARDVILDVGANTAPMIRDINQALSALDKRGLSKLTLDSRRLTEPLGRITGKVDEFTKSLEASNARVLAFTASAGALFAITKAFREMVKATVEVEKSLADINVILEADTQTLKRFSTQLFKIAGNTGQSFSQVATAATELSRQGLGVEKTLKRTSDALILARLSGMDAGKAVSSLTAILNTFKDTAITSNQVINKLAKVDAAFAVSTNDLTEAFSRVGATALEAGVSFDQLNGIVTAVQERTARGGSVIGNALRTIFTRVRRPETLRQLEALGVSVRDVGQNTLPALRILDQLSQKFDGLSDAQRSNIIQTTAGVRQGNILRSILTDLASKNSVVRKATLSSASATDEANRRNEELNKTLSAQFNRLKENARAFASTAGTDLLGPSLTKVFSGASNILESKEGVSNAGIDTGVEMGKSFLKGLGSVLAGPGLLAIGITVSRVFKNAIGFALEALKTFNAITPTAQRHASIQESISSHLRSQPGLLQSVLSGKVKIAAVEREILTILQAQRVVSMEGARAANLIAPGLIKKAGGIKRFTKKGTLSIPSAANGVPKFHSSVGDAVRREVSAGVPRTAIRLGSSSALMGPRNPSGLAITNTRDEPRGIRDIIPNFAKRRPGQPTMGFKSFDDLDKFQKTMVAVSNEAKVSSKTIKELKNSLAKSSQALNSFNRELERSQKIASNKEHIRNKVTMFNPGVPSSHAGNRGILLAEHSESTLAARSNFLNPGRGGVSPESFVGAASSRSFPLPEGFKKKKSRFFDRTIGGKKPGEFLSKGSIPGFIATSVLSSAAASQKEGVGKEVLGGLSGAAESALMGGIIGSAIPIIGTAAGAVAGAVFGVAKETDILKSSLKSLSSSILDFFKRTGFFSETIESFEKSPPGLTEQVAGFGAISSISKPESIKFLKQAQKDLNDLRSERIADLNAPTNFISGQGQPGGLFGGTQFTKSRTPQANINRTIDSIFQKISSFIENPEKQTDFLEALNIGDRESNIKALNLILKDIGGKETKEAAEALNLFNARMADFSFTVNDQSRLLGIASTNRISGIKEKGAANRFSIRTRGLGAGIIDPLESINFNTRRERAGIKKGGENEKNAAGRAIQEESEALISKTVTDLVNRLAKEEFITLDQKAGEKARLIEEFGSPIGRGIAMNTMGPSHTGDAALELEIKLKKMYEKLADTNEEITVKTTEALSTADERNSVERKILKVSEDINNITQKRLASAEITAKHAGILFRENRGTGAAKASADKTELNERIAVEGLKPGDFGKGAKIAFQSSFQKNNVDVFNTVMNSVEELASTLKDGLTTALADTILGAKSASEAFSNLANAILKMVVKSGLETAFDAVLSSAGKRFASGGIVTGGSGVRDDVPAKLTSGEFVVKRSAVSKVGMPFLNALNSGGFASLAGGGFANVNLSNKTNFIGSQRRPSGMKFDIDPSLSAFALQDGPLSNRRNRRASQFYQGRANYAAAMKSFEAQKKARRMAAMINVGVQVGAAGLQGGFNRGGGAGGVDPGGEIPLNSGGNVPAMLTGGEVVINRQASQAIGSVGMNRINNGQVAGFSGGGSVGGSSKGMRSESVEKIVESLLDIKEEIKIGNKTSSSTPKAKKQGGSSTPISLSMPISITNVNEGGGSGGQESDDNSTEEDDERTKMANDLLETMKAAALDVINEQQRPGGILFDAS